MTWPIAHAMTIPTPRERAKALRVYKRYQFSPDEVLVIAAAIEADRRALLAEDEAVVEVMARAMFGPAGERWDEKWAALHENEWKEDHVGILISGKAGYIGEAKIALDALRRHRGIEPDGPWFTRLVGSTPGGMTTEPSAWAMERARKIVCPGQEPSHLKPWEIVPVALALDAVRAEVIAELKAPSSEIIKWLYEDATLYSETAKRTLRSVANYLEHNPPPHNTRGQ